MTEDIDSLVQSISMNQVLVALLEEYGKLTVPTLKFLDVDIKNKELVIDYDEDGPSFTFSLRDKNEQ
jgi:spore cortex formation protein SpoVR/YcgB (stage V sporulation)